MRQDERSLQAEIMLRLTAGAWPLIAIPVPNGAWIPARSAAEKILVARLVARLKADGMLLPGAPDLCLLWPGGGALVELKRPARRDPLGRRVAAGRPSAAQSALAARARELGIHHLYATSWEALAARLRGWGAGPAR
jgi:hypothetical protein